MAEFRIEFRNSFLHFDFSYNLYTPGSGFSFTIGTKKPKQKCGWRSFGWSKQKGWWKWHQATPV